MTARPMLAVAVLTLLAAPASAAERPQLLPQRDVTVAYHVSSTARDAPDAVRVQFKAGGAKLRAEPDNQPGYAIVDRDSGRAMMVMPKLQMWTDIKLGDSIDRYLRDPDAKFRRTGSGTVAGIACTEYAMQSPQASGQGCVTADGVILRASGVDRRGEKGTIEAVRVDYAPIPDAQFAPPSNFHRFSLENLAKSFQLPR